MPGIAADALLTAAADASAVSVSVVTDDREFAALSRPWNDIVASMPPRRTLLTHEWFTAAWAWRRLDSRLAVFVVRDVTRIVAILPLVRPHSNARRLEFLAVPDTQIAELVVRDEDAGRAALSLANNLARRRDWDELRLDHLPQGGPLADHFGRALVDRRLHVTLQRRHGNPFLSLDATWPHYLASRSRRLKKAINLAANRVSNAGSWRVVCIDATSDASTFDEALNAAIDISAKSWKKPTGNSLGDPGPQAFFRALASGAATREALRVWLLFVDDRPLAMEVQLASGADVHALRADFLADREEISPGTHLFRQILERLFARGYRHYYFGPGENAYKKRWTEIQEPLLRLDAWNRTRRGTLGWIVECGVKPPLRRLRAAIQARVRSPESAPE